ncbi:LTA synthase family protein [Mesobacillus jeotgali]|uniref:LTA synthase family protein n=1 Tax=Mesobacillus jeotgali TaxID=129985 RepID=UPI001592AC92|nr:LTA synthase family protein [Mesobacillus jeotgali]
MFKYEYLLFFADFPFLFLLQKKVTRRNIQIGAKKFLILVTINFIILFWGFYRSSQAISELSKYNSLGLFAYQLMDVASETGLLFKEEKNITPDLVKSSKPSQLNAELQLRGSAKNKNLIIVQLESVQSFLLNKRIGGAEITPNLNKLIQESYFFPNFYTQVGKGNTSDAEFLINSSIYALGSEPMSTAIAGKEVPSLPRKLKQAGYYSATFHANEVSFWSRKEMYEALGFDGYFDQEYFGTEDYIAYGVSDEILYKKTVEKLASLKDEKFYAHIIALSSHYPYDLPKTKNKYTITLPEDYNGSIVGSYIKSVSYADYAFGKLIEELKKSGLYDDSLIVVYGDHQGVQTQNEKDTALVNEIIGHDYHPILDHLNVPLIVKVPFQKGKIVNSVGGLVDVYPTIANLLGLDLGEEIIFGIDLINTKTNTIGFRFYAPTGTFVTSQYAYAPGKTKASGVLTSLPDRRKREASQQSLEELNKVIDYINLSDEYIRTMK